jgi:hypothetical protein
MWIVYQSLKGVRGEQFLQQLTFWQDSVLNFCKNQLTYGNAFLSVGGNAKKGKRRQILKAMIDFSITVGFSGL